MKVHLFLLTIFISLFFQFILYIPIWDLSNSAIDLLNSDSSYSYIIYQKNAYGIIVTLNKTITKNGNVITTQNYLIINEETEIVQFEDIESHYRGKLNCDIIICPKGKFHCYIYDNKTDIIPYVFEEKGDWNLKCYDHDTGYFLFFYLMNKNKGVFYTRNEGATMGELVREDNIYDFKLENGYNLDYNEYKFPMIVLRGENIILSGKKVTLKNDYAVTMDTYHYIITQAKSNTKAYFDRDFYLYYFTYNNISDFISGYSITNIDLDNYDQSISSIQIIHNNECPFSFIDEVEIKEINFIQDTQYAYYKLFNINKNKSYYGILDIKMNKILYNIEEEFTTFIPISNNGEMLAISETSAYKICIIKNSNHDWYFYKKDPTYCKIVVLITSFTIHFCLNYCIGQSEIIFKLFIEIEGFSNFWIEKLFTFEHTIYLLFYSSFYEKFDYLKIFQFSLYEFLLNFFFINLKYDIYLSLSICIISLIGCNLLNIGILLTYYYDNLEDENEWVGVLSIRYYQFIFFGYISMLYYYHLLIFIFIAITGYKMIGIISSDLETSETLIDKFRSSYKKITDII